MQHDNETRVFTAPDKDPSEQLVGTVLAGRYRIEKLLGVGAMGAVYLGEHLKIGRRDAIKVLHSQMARDPDAIARFDRGARNVGAIRHPNVCTIYDFSDTDDGLQYLAMEFVAGEALKDIVDHEGRLPLQRGLDIACQIAAALQAAHDAGIVHRDLKPANVMIARGPNGTDAVKVVDFDISKGSTEAVEEEVTRLGYVVGTPEYMSPEQLWGGALDGRSDVYSLALVLYRVLTGGLPFRGDTMQETMSARLTDAPLMRLEEIALGGSFPPELQAALDRALKCKADERTATAAEFAAQLRAVPLGDGAPAGGAVPATRVAEVPQTVQRTAAANGAGAAGAKRTRMAIAAAGVALLAVSGFAANQVFFAGAGADPGLDEQLAAGPPTDGAATAEEGAASPDAGAADPEPPPAERRTETEQAQRTSTPRTTTEQPAAPVERREPVATDPAPVPPPQPTNALAPADAYPILDRYRERLAQSPAPPRRSLTAMRDTADMLYNLDGVQTGERGLAAMIASTSSLYLEDATACARWARLAVQQSSSYSYLTGMCQ